MDQGLYPISDFILEENFKQRINDTHSEYITSSELHEPFIEIAKVYVRTSGGEKLYKEMCIRDRYISFSKFIVNDKRRIYSQYFSQTSDAITQSISFFGISKISPYSPD